MGFEEGDAVPLRRGGDVLLSLGAAAAAALIGQELGEGGGTPVLQLPIRHWGWWERERERERDREQVMDEPRLAKDKHSVTL